MFGHAYFGATYFGPSYWGPFVEAPPPPPPPPPPPLVEERRGGSSARRRKSTWIKSYSRWKRPKKYEDEPTTDVAEAISKVVSYVDESIFVEWDAALRMLEDAERRVRVSMAQLDAKRAFYNLKSRIEAEAENVKKELLEVYEDNALREEEEELWELLRHL